LDGAEAAIITGTGKVVVTDTRNHRVLIWNTVPTVSGEPADFVLGQANFESCAPNNDALLGGTTARTMNGPSGVWSDGSRLIINDSLNNRVLIWNSFPAVSYAPADTVLGQSDFARTASNDVDQNGTSDGAPDARTLSYPYDGIDFDGRQLCIADSDNNRVLIWDSLPTENFQAADRVLGQPDFSSSLPNDSTADGSGDDPGPTTLDSPNGCYFYLDNIFVGDQDNNRVLMYEKQVL